MLISWQFIPIDSPDFVTIHDRGDLDRVTEGAIVRLQYETTREEDAATDKNRIRAEILAAGASRVTIEPQITREVRARVETMTQELGPLEALRMYAGAQGIDEATNDRMVNRLKEWIA